MFDNLTMLSFVAFFAIIFLVNAADEDPSCAGWARMGECDKNPGRSHVASSAFDKLTLQLLGYMLHHCKESCDEVKAASSADLEAIAGIKSFFELSAKDIDGNIVNFENFRGQVTVLVNVASYCGYTESHYQGLVELYSHVKDEAVNILAFPCNQFGQQEPEAADKIKEFAKSKRVEFQMMEKIDVNGSNASLVYKYMKHATGIASITWNFATYFVVSPEGVITAHSGAEPMELKGSILSLLKEEL